LAYISAAESVGGIFINHFYVISPESYRLGLVRAITPFKVIQGHRFWY